MKARSKGLLALCLAIFTLLASAASARAQTYMVQDGDPHMTGSDSCTCRANWSVPAGYGIESVDLSIWQRSSYNPITGLPKGNFIDKVSGGGYPIPLDGAA